MPLTAASNKFCVCVCVCVCEGGGDGCRSPSTRSRVLLTSNTIYTITLEQKFFLSRVSRHVHMKFSVYYRAWDKLAEHL